MFSTRLIVGLLIILLGGTLLADNLGWFEARHVLRSLWPLALVAVGVAMIRHPQHRRSRAWGWVLVTVGFWIFADKIGWIHVSLGQLILPGHPVVRRWRAGVSFAERSTDRIGG